MKLSKRLRKVDVSALLAVGPHECQKKCYRGFAHKSYLGLQLIYILEARAPSERQKDNMLKLVESGVTLLSVMEAVRDHALQKKVFGLPPSLFMSTDRITPWQRRTSTSFVVTIGLLFCATLAAITTFLFMKLVALIRFSTARGRLGRLLERGLWYGP